MNENLNLVEILKDCPEGTKLYSTVYGEVKFDRIDKIDEESDYHIIFIKIPGFKACVTSDGRLIQEFDGECTLFPSKEQRDWSKFKPKKPKFDPNTLNPFDKVLARDDNNATWFCRFFSHIIDKTKIYRYYATDGGLYKYCIPYNDDTKHLVSKTDEAPEFYRYWED